MFSLPLFHNRRLKNSIFSHGSRSNGLCSHIALNKLTQQFIFYISWGEKITGIFSSILSKQKKIKDLFISLERKKNAEVKLTKKKYL